MSVIFLRMKITQCRNIEDRNWKWRLLHIKTAVKTLHNTVIFLQNTHKRHAIQHLNFIFQTKREFQETFHQLTTFPTHINTQTNFMALISKQNTDRYIYSGFGYLACQLNCAMLFQWGLANWKSPVRPVSGAPARVWRTLCYIDGLVQACSNSIAIALELLQSCTEPMICNIML